jgi:hypothetical protein
MYIYICIYWWHLHMHIQSVIYNILIYYFLSQTRDFPFFVFHVFCRIRMGMQADSLVNVPRRSAGCLADEFQLLGFTTYVIFPKEIPLLGNLYRRNVSKAIVNHPQFYHFCWWYKPLKYGWLRICFTNIKLV